MARPYASFGGAQLRELFEANQEDLTILLALQSELIHRTVPTARRLAAEVDERVQQLRAAPAETPATPAPHAPRGTAPCQPIAEPQPSATTHPDDQRRPPTLSRMRPPGTSGLPDAWQRPLDESVALPVSANAEPSELFRAALTALIAEIRRSGAGQKRYELEHGERQDAAGDDTIYSFPFADEADLFEEAQVELQLAGRRIEGTIVSISGGRLLAALREDVGPNIAKATLLIDTTALLNALVAKLDQVGKGEISLNRELADSVVGRTVTPTPPPPFTAVWKTQLLPAQQRACEETTSAAVTWIWGPPGCGKTQTLSEIVRAAFESGRRVLVCSNTNKAVDQVIYRICQTLTPSHPAKDGGLIVRLGRIADDKLKEFADYVTIDGIVERRSEELAARRTVLERELELLGQRVSANQNLLSRFRELDLAMERLTISETQASKLDADMRAVREAQAQNQRRKSDLLLELQKRQGAFFTLLSRSEEAIKADLQTCDAETLTLDQRLAAVAEALRTAKQEVDALAFDVATRQSTVAGHDRAAITAAVQEAADQRGEMLGELREIEAKLAALRDSILRDAKILGITCTKAYMAVQQIGQVDMVIIGEASMVTLPVAWFAAGLAKERVVICGDFCQIPPIVPTSQRSIYEAIGRDVFTINNLQQDRSRLKMLDTQFRMHESICDLISEPMYKGDLKTSPDRSGPIYDVPAPFNQPLTIIDTSDLWPFESQNAFFSRFNLLHALLLRNVASHFAANDAVKGLESVGICTPYSAQAKIVSKLLAGEGLDQTQVGTVHSYQGDERETMVLDVPESHGAARTLGQFVQGIPPEHVGARLINVAISRAKHRLIAIANLTYLDKRLPSGSLLRSILFDMQQNGVIVSGKDVLALRPIASDLRGLVGFIPLNEQVETLGIFDEMAFEQALAHDIRNAQKTVVIFSGYITPARVGKLGDLLRLKIAEGVKVRCVTRPPRTNGSIPPAEGKAALDMLQGIGVTVDCHAKIHQKVCLIDGKIVWLGSLNALSHAGRSDETMIRTVNEGYATAVAGHMSKRRISADRAASTVADAENPSCGDCGARTIYAEGKFGPFFMCESECGWRANAHTVHNSDNSTASDDVGELPREGPDCPKCRSATRLRRSRRGSFYGCTKYPACDGTINPMSSGRSGRA